MSTQTGLIIGTDGSLATAVMPHSPHKSLSMMYRALRCNYVDVVRLAEGLDMWLDDEGMFRHPVNLHATVLARSYGCVWQNYYGPVLLCGVDDNGQSIGLGAEHRSALGERLRGLIDGRYAAQIRPLLGLEG